MPILNVAPTQLTTSGLRCRYLRRQEDVAGRCSKRRASWLHSLHLWHDGFKPGLSPDLDALLNCMQPHAGLLQSGMFSRWVHGLALICGPSHAHTMWRGYNSTFKKLFVGHAMPSKGMDSLQFGAGNASTGRGPNL